MLHHWQDAVMTISILVFNIALIPSVASKSKPALATSVITTFFLLATVAVYVSLSLWFTTVMASINACLWATLAVQKAREPKTRKP